MIKGPTWIVDRSPPQVIYDVPPEREPDPLPPPEPQPRPDTPQPQQRVPLDAPPRHVPVPQPGQTADPSPTPPEWTGTIGTAPIGSGTVPVLPPEPPVRPVDPPRPAPAPVRVAAEFDPRYAGDLQPPYPAVEQRQEREGSVRVQVTIGANGGVLAVQRVSATSEAFWRATERQALSRWRFRPATVDGRPVESRKTLTVHFRLNS